jgi:glutathione S-transferase
MMKPMNSNKTIVSWFLFVTVLLSNSSRSSALAAAASSKPVLKYFDIRGVAETSRILLAIGGEDYDDARYQIDPATFASAAFITSKESGDLKANLNRAPVLVTPDGTTIGQSKAIERYLAKRFNMMGNSDEEAAVIDCIAEHCRDVKDAAAKKGFSMFVKDKTEEEKAKARAEWFDEDLPVMLGKIDDCVSDTGNDDGFSVGSSISYADVVIWALLRDCSPADAEDTTKAAINCKTLNSIADAIAAHPSVSNWIETRPETMF